MIEWTRKGTSCFRQSRGQPSLSIAFAVKHYCRAVVAYARTVIPVIGWRYFELSSIVADDDALQAMNASPHAPMEDSLLRSWLLRALLRQCGQGMG